MAARPARLRRALNASEFARRKKAATTCRPCCPLPAKLQGGASAASEPRSTERASGPVALPRACAHEQVVSASGNVACEIELLSVAVREDERMELWKLRVDLRADVRRGRPGR